MTSRSTDKIVNDIDHEAAQIPQHDTCSLNYQRIAKAIEYIHQQANAQPSLEEIAASVHLSPYHFQRLFTQWAGVSPKKFMQYLTLEHAKKILQKGQASVEETSDEVGLSSPSRLHDLFVQIEAMTPGEFKRGGNALTINYQITETPFGRALVASTAKGVCQLQFVESEQAGITLLSEQFPFATFQPKADAHQSSALSIFSQDWQQLPNIKLHLQGTPFQLKVWQALLAIPAGGLASYQHIAGMINQPKAARAVGSAIGRNPIAYLIPCHRVIQTSGHYEGYRWGSTRKSAMIGREAAQTQP